jgi:diguanylate cyclase (GGDEF)-like protein
VVGGEMSQSLPEWLPGNYLKIGIFVIILLYGFYVFEKELQLRKISRYLIDEQFEVDVVNRRLKSVETVLESSKVINSTDNLDRALETIVLQASSFMNERDLCLYLIRSDGDLTPSIGNTDQRLITLAAKVMELNQSRFGKDPKLPGMTHFAVPVSRRERHYGALGMSTATQGLDTFEILMTMSLFAEQVATAITQARMNEQHKMHEHQELHQITHDRLTGLLSRSEFFDQLDTRIHEYGDAAPRIGLIFLKIDDLKRFNNSLGFAVGDAIIQRHADSMRSAISEDAMAGRFGGDSFMVALFDVSGYEEAMEIAATLQTALAPAIAVSNRRLNITTSIGVALPETFDVDASSLIRDAHIATYHAKSKGGNQICRFEADLLDNADRILDLEADLKRAIENDELGICLQPIVNLKSMQTMGLEALLQWQHPENGIIPATSFIPFATETGQLAEIDLRVIRKSCEAIKQLQAKGFQIPLHVNVFPKFLNSAGMVASIDSILKEYGIQPDRFVIEISENDPLLESEKTQRNIRTLKGLGFHIALDNFGTGSAALGMLNQLPLDMAKVSKSLINDLTDEHSKDAELFRTIMTLSESLKLKVVAVGIENDKQVEVLREMGFDTGQGYYLGKPMQLQAFIDSKRAESSSIDMAG